MASYRIVGKEEFTRRILARQACRRAREERRKEREIHAYMRTKSKVAND